MRIGLILSLHGRPNGDGEQPSWQSVRAKALEAERVGFDMVVFEDALLYKGAIESDGSWESFAIAAALAEATSTIHFGQSVVNSPYRSPALTAKLAHTVDEISGGRYVLGIGAGNTADSDYRAFGFPTDRRYSRFAESIEIIHSLLKTGRADFVGEFASAIASELVLDGAREAGPPINIAGAGPRMLELVAKFGDAWNWWAHDETMSQIEARLGEIIKRLDDACEAHSRDPSELERTLDLYTVIPPGFSADGSGLTNPVLGSASEIAGFLLQLETLGFDEVRCGLHPESIEAVTAMQPVIALVHAG